MQLTGWLIIHLQISILAHLRQGLTQFHRRSIALWPISLSQPWPSDSSTLTSPSSARPLLWVMWPPSPIASASSIRLNYSPAPSPLIQTYQSQLHGQALHSIGLPQCAVDACLLSFLQEFILDVFAGNQPVPETIAIWVKGRHQMALFSRLVESLPCPGIALLVRDLEDISCPPAKQLLQLHHNNATTRDKMHAYLDWLSEQNLGQTLVSRTFTFAIFTSQRTAQT